MFIQLRPTLVTEAAETHRYSFLTKSGTPLPVLGVDATGSADPSAPSIALMAVSATVSATAAGSMRSWAAIGRFLPRFLESKELTVGRLLLVVMIRPKGKSDTTGCAPEIYKEFDYLGPGRSLVCCIGSLVLFFAEDWYGRVMTI